MTKTNIYIFTPFLIFRLLIPMHEDLRFAGQLPPLDAPHHMRATEWCPYRCLLCFGALQMCNHPKSTQPIISPVAMVCREGVVLSSAKGDGSLLDIGLGRVSKGLHGLVSKAIMHPVQ